jgi:hypothetical protein
VGKRRTIRISLRGGTAELAATSIRIRHSSTGLKRPVRRCGSKGSVGSGISLLTRHFLKRVQNKLAVVLVGLAQ